MLGPSIRGLMCWLGDLGSYEKMEHSAPSRQELRPHNLSCGRLQRSIHAHSGGKTTDRDVYGVQSK